MHKRRGVRPFQAHITMGGGGIGRHANKTKALPALSVVIRHLYPPNFRHLTGPFAALVAHSHFAWISTARFLLLHIMQNGYA